MLQEIFGDIGSNIANFVHTSNISNIVCHKKLLKFHPLLISKFKFGLVHGKMLNDTHLKVIKINYSKYTKQQWRRGVLMKNIADSVPSVSSLPAFLNKIKMRI